MGPGRAAQVGLAVATGAGLVGGLLTQNHAERTRPHGRSFEYTTVGNAFIPLPHKATQQNLLAMAGAGVVAGVGTRLAGHAGALGGAGLVLQGAGVGFLVGETMGFIW